MSFEINLELYRTRTVMVENIDANKAKVIATNKNHYFVKNLWWFIFQSPYLTRAKQRQIIKLISNPIHISSNSGEDPKLKENFAITFIAQILHWKAYWKFLPKIVCGIM